MAFSAAVLAVTEAMAAATFVLRDGRGLPDGWYLASWGGVEAGIVSNTLRIGPKNEEVTAWAGCRLTVAENVREQCALKFDRGQWERFALNFKINGGKNLTGQNEGGQPVQVGVSFSLAKGKSVDGSMTGIGRFTDGGSIDADPKTWQDVSIPLSEFGIAKEARDSVAGLAGITFQFASASPVLSAIHIEGIEVGEKAGFLGAAQRIAPPAADPGAFPRFAELKPPLLAPRDPVFTIDRFGNWCLDGRPRFVIGAQVPEMLRVSLQHTSGYPDELKWIYDEPLDYERAQRLGFDALGYFINDDWQREIAPGHKTISWPPDRDFMSKFFAGARLPFYVDFTCAPWSNGSLAGDKVIPAEAKNSRGAESESNHWVPYAVLHPEGRKIYRAMWEAGARHLKEAGGRALFYELFNEPAYDDPSDYNRAEFSRWLVGKYGSIAKLNSTWRTQYADFAAIAKFKTRYDNPALFVDWSKFMEDAFVSLCREGRDAIRAIDPGARVCVQQLGGGNYRSLPWCNVNQYKLADVVDVVSTETRGGIEYKGRGGLVAAPAHTINAPFVSPQFEGMVQRHFMRSIARGKPIHDGEHYVDGWDMSDCFWLQLARVGNGAFIFKWDKRPWDVAWGADKSAEGGRELARQMPYVMLNPYSVAPAKLPGILQFKREMLMLDDLFVPRQNFARSEIAVLLSFPTERYQHGVRGVTQHFFRNYAVMLDFSHYGIDVVLEEQLAERLGEYKVLVAAGDSNVLPESPEKIRSWVEAGGCLVLGLEALQMDEYGNPLANDWLGLQVGMTADEGKAELKSSVRAASLPGDIMARPHRAVTANANWEIEGMIANKPAIFRRKLGRGSIWFINAKMDDYALASVLGGILDRAGIRPAAELARADNGELEVNVELRKFSNGQLTGWFLYNWDAYAKNFTFRAPELAAGDIALADPLGHLQISITNGTAGLSIPSTGKRILLAGPRDLLEKRFGPLKAKESP